MLTPIHEWRAFTDGSTTPMTPSREPSGVGVPVLLECTSDPGLTVERAEAIRTDGDNFVAEAFAALLAVRMCPINHPGP